MTADKVQCPKRKLGRAFLHGLIDNDDKLASSKKHTQFKTRVFKPYPMVNTNGQNRSPIGPKCFKLPNGSVFVYLVKVFERMFVSNRLTCADKHTSMPIQTWERTSPDKRFSKGLKKTTTATGASLNQ